MVWSMKTDRELKPDGKAVRSDDCARLLIRMRRAAANRAEGEK
jgi:hypothetical protein